MIAKPSMITPTSSYDWILNSIEKSSYPSIPIKNVPLMDDNDDDDTDSQCRPSSSMSSKKNFTWSDFPCYGNDPDTIHVTSSTAASLSRLGSSRPSTEGSKAPPHDSCALSSSKTATINQPNIVEDENDDCDDLSYCSKSPIYSLQDYIPRALPSPPPSPTSCCDVLSMDDTTIIDQISPSNPLSSTGNIPTHHQKMKQRVSFAPLVRVRTHTIVLGDHPLCSGGMAMQLGWESSKTQYVPLHSASLSRRDDNNASSSWTMLRSTHYHQTKRSLSQLRLNYQQRRQRLMELTGYTSCQLLHQEYLLVCCRDSTTTTTTGDV